MAKRPRENGLSEMPFDFRAWKKKVLSNPAARAVIEDFLRNRHREWELAIEAGRPAGESACPTGTKSRRKRKRPGTT